MRTTVIRRLLLPALLAIHAGLLAYGAAIHSPSIDEVGHLAAGLSHWQLGRFDLYHVNPPLVRMIAVVPVLFVQPKTDWSQYSDAPGRGRSSPSAATSSRPTASARSGSSPGRGGPASRSTCWAAMCVIGGRGSCTATGPACWR